MDKSFHEIQANIAKRLIHSDRHSRRRRSIAPNIAACHSKNHDLSRLMSKNEVLFKSLEGKMSSLENEQRRREIELSRTERALAGSVRKRSLPHVTKYQGQQKSQALRQTRRNSLATSEQPVSPNELVQEWLRRFDRNNYTSTNTLEIPHFFDGQDHSQQKNASDVKADSDSQWIGAENAGNEPLASTSTFTEENRASSRQSLYTLAARIPISDGEKNSNKIGASLTDRV